MARQSLFEVKLDVGQIEKLKDRLAGLNPEEFGAALVETVNAEVRGAYDLARRSILAGVNIERGYLESRFEVNEATSKKPVAEIVTPVNKRTAATNLSHYGSVRFSKAVKHPERSIGDTYRGFAPGQKADFMTSQVLRGQDKSIGGKFVIPGIEDSAKNPIVFRGLGKPGRPKNPRDKATRKTPRQAIQPVLGPAPYQLFRFTAGEIQEAVADSLEDAVVTRVREIIEDAFR